MPTTEDPFADIGFASVEKEDPFADVEFAEPTNGRSLNEQPVETGATSEDPFADVGFDEPRTRSIETDAPDPAILAANFKANLPVEAQEEIDARHIDDTLAQFGIVGPTGKAIKERAGGLEGIAHVAAGAAAFIPAGVTGLLTIGLGKSQDWKARDILNNKNIDLTTERRLELTSQLMNPEDIDAAANEARELFTKFLPEPQSESAKAIISGANKVMEKALFWAPKVEEYFDEKDMPNAGSSLRFLLELAAFKIGHVVGGKIVRKVKKINKKLQENKTPIDVEKDIEALKDLVDVNDPALISEYKAYKIDEAKVVREAKVAKEGAEKQRQLQAELERNIPAPRKPLDPLVYPEKPLRSGDPALTAREAREGKAGADVDIARPLLGEEAVSGTKALPVMTEAEYKTRVKNITEEGIPKTEFQINPETGKAEKTFEAGERKGYQVSKDGVTLIENVPGQKSVWQIVRNESGAVDLNMITEAGKKLLRFSKIRGEKGEILPLFHSAKSGEIVSKEFDPKESNEIGPHFATELQTKNMYGKGIFNDISEVVPVVLNIKNPLRLEDRGTFSPRAVLNQIKERKLISGLEFGSKKHNKIERAMHQAVKRNENLRHPGPAINKKQGKALRDFLQEEGYDGIVYRNTNELEFYDKAKHGEAVPIQSVRDAKERFSADSYISFKPEQVISAYDKRLWKQQKQSPIFNPLKNQSGAIEINFKKSQRDAVKRLSKQALKSGLKLDKYLEKKGMGPADVQKVMAGYEKLQAPMKEMLPVKKGPEDFSALDPLEFKANITKSALGKKANKKLHIKTKDAETFMNLVDKPIGSLYKFFQVPETFFNKYKELRPLLDQAREAAKVIKTEKAIAIDYAKKLAQRYNSKKSREELGVHWHSLNEFGAEAMKLMGKTSVKNPKYLKLKAELEPQFKDLLDRVNEAREKIGKQKITFADDYLSFFLKESLFDDFKGLFVGKKGERFSEHNLVLDDVATIAQRHGRAVTDSSAFRHNKRFGINEGQKIELDPLAIYSRYLNAALPHIHNSPINAFIKEMLTQKLTIPGRKTKTFGEDHPSIAAELGSWNNKLAGKSNLPLPPAFEKLLMKATSNLTASVLGGNIRTVLVQGTAIVPTYSEYGAGAVMKATKEFVSRKDIELVKKSSALDTRVMEAGLDDYQYSVAGTKFEKATAATRRGGLYFSQKVDYMAAEITWRTAYNSMKKEIANGKISQKEAIRRADSAVVRLQGSGSPIDLSPIQRNALGKAATLWQTFTINHANWIVNNLMDAKNSKLSTKEAIVRATRYIGGVAVVNTLYEDVMGIQSPFPAPIKALIRGLEEGDGFSASMLNVLLEISETFPITGSLKFGSNPFGPVVQFAADIAEVVSGNDMIKKDLLPKAMAGDKKAMLAIAELLAKAAGVTGAGQIAKATRGLMRGESLPRAIIGHLPGETGKLGQSDSRARSSVLRKGGVRKSEERKTVTR